MVSVAHMHVSLLVWNTLSALYRLAMGITAEQVSLCVFWRIVYLSCSIVLQVTQLNDVPSTEMSSHVEHLVLSLLFI